MGNLDNVNPETIRKLYWEDGKTIRAIAQIYNVKRGSIDWFMRYNNIPRRALSNARNEVQKKINLDPEMIRKLYWEQGLTMPQIAMRYHTHTNNVYRLMQKYNIPSRKQGDRGGEKDELDPEMIRKLYWDDKLSARQIAKKLGKSDYAIYIVMYRSEIPRRTASEVAKLKYKKGETKSMATQVNREDNLIEYAKTDPSHLNSTWADILEKLKDKCPARLHAMLKEVSIVSIDDSALTLDIDSKYKLHREELEDSETKKQIESGLSDVMGKSMKLVICSNEAYFPEIVNQAPSTTRGKVMEALEVKQIEAQTKESRDMQEHLAKLDDEIKQLNEKKVKVGLDIQKIDSDIRNTNFIRVSKKNIEKKRLELLDMQRQEIETDIEELTKERESIEFASSLLAEIDELQITIRGFQDMINNVSAKAKSLKTAIKNQYPIF